jgi:shikimate dehydrogenase
MLTQLSGATRLFPIIGDPIQYVESPVWFTRTLADRGHNGICIPMRVPPGTLDVVMAGLTAASNVDGVLVTMPHKHAAFAHCATSSERAGLLGVVSVIRRNPDGTWHGDMLDGLAFVKAQKDHGARVEGARALLVGAGGAGSANATPLGMEDGDPLPLDATLLTASMFVGDVIAGHGVTPFVAAAQAAGCKTASGGHMVEAVQKLMADFMLGQ